MKCCQTCKNNLTIERLDYTEGGCKHSLESGFVCLALACEGVAYHMVGVSMVEGICEMYTERRRNDQDTR